MEKVGQNIIRSFIKIGQKEHIDQLWKKGVVFMNPINFFIQMDDDEQRKDVYEGIERMEQITKIEFKWDNKSIKLDKDSEQNKLINAQLRVHNPELRGNIFSMIGITSELSSKTDKIDSRNANFGDSFLLILNPSEFLNRFDKAIKEMGLSYDWDIVKYYDERVFEGVLDIFCK